MSEINGQGSGGQVIAERSGWPVAGTVMLWGISAAMAALLAVEQAMIPGGIGEWKMLWTVVAIVTVAIGAVFYTCCAVITPKILAEYRDGVIILHPTVSKTVTLRPEEIIFVAQRNYHGHVTYSSGKLTISTTKGNIAVRWVKNADEARRKLEFFRNSAMSTPPPARSENESGFV